MRRDTQRATKERIYRLSETQLNAIERALDLIQRLTRSRVIKKQAWLCGVVLRAGFADRRQ